MEKYITWAANNKIIVIVVLVGLAYLFFGGDGEFAGWPVGDK